MALTNRKITGWAQPIVSLDDKPKLTAAALKAAFDSNSNELKPAINGMIDDLTGTGGAGEIGTSPIEGVTGTDVQTMLAFLKGLIDLRDPATEVDRKLALKADTATVAKLVETVAFNAQTGVFTITEQGGTVHEIDTVLEKVPVSCRLDGQDFVLTLEDGTEQRASLGAFLTPQEFANSDTVQFEVAGNTIRAKIKSGSINADMLTGTILEELTAFRDAAARSAQNAASSEQNAAAYKTAAAGSAQEAGEKAAESGGQAANARSWAAGGTGTRAGEDTDNAKYYRDQAMLSATQAVEKAGAASADAARAEKAAENAEAIAGGDFIPSSQKGKPGGVATLDENGKVNATELPKMDYLPLSGGEVSGPLLVGEPRGKMEAANKEYVDSSISGKTLEITPQICMVFLNVEAWNPDHALSAEYAAEYYCDCEVSGVLKDETRQIIWVSPTMDSRSAYEAAGVRCIANGENKLTFAADSVPDGSITVIVSIQKAVSV